LSPNQPSDFGGRAPAPAIHKSLHTTIQICPWPTAAAHHLRPISIGAMVHRLPCTPHLFMCATGLAVQLVLGDAAAFFSSGWKWRRWFTLFDIYTDDATSSNRVVRWITTRWKLPRWVVIRMVTTVMAAVIRLCNEATIVTHSNE